MALARKQKILLILAPIAILLLYVAFQGIKFWWYRGYSQGTRTGTIRKLSMKGPPYCKYFSGELVLQSTQPGQATEIWEFSIDDEDEKNPLLTQLHDAEKNAKPVTITYRQDLHSMYRCTPSEYFVTKVEK